MRRIIVILLLGMIVWVTQDSIYAVLKFKIDNELELIDLELSERKKLKTCFGEIFIFNEK